MTKEQKIQEVLDRLEGSDQHLERLSQYARDRFNRFPNLTSISVDIGAMFVIEATVTVTWERSKLRGRSQPAMSAVMVWWEIHGKDPQGGGSTLELLAKIPDPDGSHQADAEAVLQGFKDAGYTNLTLCKVDK